jgi:hypothetical protein
MLCDEGMITAKVRSSLLVPQSTKQVTPPKTYNHLRKTNKFCIICGITMWKHVKNKIKITVAITKAAQLNQKLQKTSLYAYHICGLNGHKMTNYPKFIKIQKMFHEKYVIVAKVQPIAKTQKIIADVNVVDVNVTTRSKAIEEQVSKDREPRKAKNVVDWERRMVEEINGGDNSIDLKNIDLDRKAIHIHRGMEHNLVRYAKYYFCGST